MEYGVFYDQNELGTIVGEQWLPIPSSLIPNIKPFYYISNKGRVWSINIGKFGGLMKQFLNHKGYPHIQAKRNNMGPVDISIHRIEMILFKWIPGYENLEVNHIDGDKTNNDINNLEWVTPSQNVIHAYQTGLKHKLIGEECPFSKYTEEQIHRLCQGIEKNLSAKECLQLAGLPVEKKWIVNSVKNGQTWVDISNQYNITKTPAIKLFTDDEIHKICSLLELGFNRNEILNIIKPNLDINDQSRYSKVIYNISKRNSYNYISNNYNF